MRRVKDDFLHTLNEHVPLASLEVLEIGCGDGARSAGIARRCRILVGIDPDECRVALAQKRGIKNAIFGQGVAQDLKFGTSIFDLAVFALSLHHVPPISMCKAINEAIRVVKSDGHIVFLEPGTEGSFFEAEIEFGAFDGDERQAKEVARQTMTTHPGIVLQHEERDETVFVLSSPQDFIDSASPKKNLGRVPSFLKNHKNQLRAERVISIYRPT